MLEIGCGDGENVIPMAFMLPGSSFAGIDLAASAIEKGREAICELDLKNIRLESADLMDLGAGLGEFDYIIAHGFYSWVPAPVRDKLLELVRRCLAPKGVAFVSYNAYPGCRVREMIREMLLFHLRSIQGIGERMRAAREFLNMMLSSRKKGEDHTDGIKKELERMLKNGDWTLLHDEAAPVYFPIYFADFMKHAAQHGLQYLDEANFFDFQDWRAPAGVAEALASDRIELEQYRDFLSLRKFHRTLLVHRELRVADEAGVGLAVKWHAASEAVAVSQNPRLDAGYDEEFTSEGTSLKTFNPLTKAALMCLISDWPRTIPFDDLRQQCRELTGAESGELELAEVLVQLYRSGLAELHTVPRICASKPGELPSTTALARWQAQRGTRVTTVLHTLAHAEGAERKLLTLLDGSRNRGQLAAELRPYAAEVSESQLMGLLEGSLNKLARMGLLVA